MRLTINAADLAASVKVTGTAVTARPQMPILAGVLLNADGEHLEASAFDYESAARSRCPGTVDTAGTIVVSHRPLSNVVASVKSGPITLDDSEGPLVVTAGRSVWRLPRMRTDEYPNLPDVGDAFATVDAADFARAVESVVTAAADESPVQLDCIRVGIETGALELAGCNTHRLHVADLIADVTSGAGEFLLVHARRLQAMTKHLGSGELRLRRTDNLFAVSDSTSVLSTRLTEGEWIKHRQLLETTEANVKVTVTLDRDQLASALRQVARFAEASDRARLVTMSFEQHGELSIVAGTEAEGSGMTVMDTEHDGRGLRVVANLAYLSNALDTLSSPAARLTFSAPARPIGLAAEGQPLSAVVQPLKQPASAWLDDEAAVA